MRLAAPSRSTDRVGRCWACTTHYVRCSTWVSRYAIIFYVDYVLAIAGGLLGAFVLIDAVMRKPDAFVAADRQTKTVWVAILAGAALFLILAALPSFITAMDLLWIAGCIAALVYLVDVRPRLRDIQRGTRW